MIFLSKVIRHYEMCLQQRFKKWQKSILDNDILEDNKVQGPDNNQISCSFLCLAKWQVDVVDTKPWYQNDWIL